MDYWQINITQNNRMLAEQNGEVGLTKNPFSIIVRAPKALTVKLNVSDSEKNFQRVYPGFNLDLKKNGYRIHPFVEGMSFGEDFFNKDETLILDEKGNHYLFYNNEGQHRWTRADTLPGGFIFERKVSSLLINREKVPIENISKSRLYFLFLVKFVKNDIVSPDELKKLVLKLS
jgi:hypothetical protein